MPSISSIELPLRTILCNPIFGPFLTPILFVLNLNDDDFTCHSGDWSSWKDKLLKCVNAAWTFGGEHATANKNSFFHILMFLILALALVVLLLLVPQFRVLVANIFSAIFKTIVFILKILLKATWIAFKYILLRVFSCLGWGRRGIRRGSLAAVYQSIKYGGATLAGTVLSWIQSFAARGGARK